MAEGERLESQAHFSHEYGSSLHAGCHKEMMMTRPKMSAAFDTHA